MNWYLKVLKQYADFDGRARRKEYWMFVLFNVIISFAISLVENLLGLTLEGGYGPISGLYSLAVIIPSIAVAVRRLHDIGKSGWWFLLIFIPLIGAIWLIVLFVQDGEPGTNVYGPNPKEIDATI